MRVLPCIRLSVLDDASTSPERQLDKIQTFVRLGSTTTAGISVMPALRLSRADDPVLPLGDGVALWSDIRDGYHASRHGLSTARRSGDPQQPLRVDCRGPKGNRTVSVPSPKPS